jgi:signal transduction histidine kinase
MKHWRGATAAAKSSRMEKPRFKILSFLLTLASSLAFVVIFLLVTFIQSRGVIEQQAATHNRSLALRYEERIADYLRQVESETLMLTSDRVHIETLYRGDAAQLATQFYRWEAGYENRHYDVMAIFFFESGRCIRSLSYAPELSQLFCEELIGQHDQFQFKGWTLRAIGQERLAVYTTPLYLHDSGKIVGLLLSGVRMRGNRYLLNSILNKNDELQRLVLVEGSRLLSSIEPVAAPGSSAPVALDKLAFSDGMTPLGPEMKIGLLAAAGARRQLHDALIETLLYGCALSLLASLISSFLLSSAVDRQLQQLIDFTRLAHHQGRTRWPQSYIHEFNLIGAEVIAIVNRLKAREETLQSVNQQLLRNIEEKQQILQHLMETQERERLRLSNELHDDMAQLLVAARLHLQLQRREQEQTGLAQQNLQLAIELIDKIYDTVYHRIRMLRPHELSDFGLGVSLTNLPVIHLLEQLDYAIELDIEQHLPLQSEVVSNLYRIAQEALSNVSRHAGGTWVLVRLRDEPAGLRMTIADDGVGFTPQQGAGGTGAGCGLMSIHERASHLHARLDIRSDQGVCIDLLIPSEYAYQSIADADEPG